VYLIINNKTQWDKIENDLRNIKHKISSQIDINILYLMENKLKNNFIEKYYLFCM